MNEIMKSFEYVGNSVRTVLKNDEVWFVAKDVCEVLGIKNITQTINGQERQYDNGDKYYSGGLDEDEKATYTIPTQYGKKEMNVVNESGLYQLIFKSRKHEAKQFKRWVTHEVIPAIRKHGGYLTPEKVEEALINPDTIIMLATQLKEERAQRERDKPKVLFAEALETSTHSILIGELAKLLKQNGIDIGQKRLFSWMREKGYLIRKHGDEYNNPTQRAMDLGLFEIKKRTLLNNDGTVRVTKTTKVTGKGQSYFINKFIHNLQLR